MDTVDVLRLRESLSSGVASLTCPAGSLGFTKPVEMDLGVALINVLEQAADDEPRLPWQRQHQLKMRLDN